VIILKILDVPEDRLARVEALGTTRLPRQSFQALLDLRRQAKGEHARSGPELHAYHARFIETSAW
jgi:hypothetical protein